MTLNSNVQPYFNDYDEDKQFYQILFKPGVAVQARELTQLQSILQKQIERFGSHVFNSGSMVIPGQIYLDTQFAYVKLQNNNTLGTAVNTFIEDFVGKRIIGQTTGVKAEVVFASALSGTDPNTIFVKYLNSGTDGETKVFADGESLVTDEVTPIEALAALSAATGNGSSVAIERGVYFVRDRFVLVKAQRIVLEKNNQIPSYRVGLTINEEFVTSDDDTSLLDNAQGSYNFSAPGADRVMIDLVLEKKELTDTEDAEFVELLVVDRGVIQRLVDKSDYTELLKTLARRTFAESGNYVVDPFKLQIKEHRNNNRGAWSQNDSYEFGDVVTYNGNTYVCTLDGISSSSSPPTHGIGEAIDGTTKWLYEERPEYNLGVYAPSVGGSSAKIVYQLDPGLGFVNGYEVEKIGFTNLEIDKARDFARLTDQVINASYGNYLTLKNVAGFPDTSVYANIELRNEANVIVGSARARDFYPDTTTGQYRVALTDVTILSANTFTKDVKRVFATGSPNFSAEVVLSNLQLSGSITIPAAGNVITGNGTRFNSELQVGEYIQALGRSNVWLVTAITNDQSLNVAGPFNSNSAITNAAFDKKFTEIKETNKNSLVYLLPQNFIRSIRAEDDIELNTTYSVRERFVETAVGNVLTLAATGVEDTFASEDDLSGNYVLTKVSGAGSGNVGDIITPTSATRLSSNRQIQFILPAAYAGDSIAVIATVQKFGDTDAREKTKTLVRSATIDVTAAANAQAVFIPLNKADVYRVVKVVEYRGLGFGNAIPVSLPNTVSAIDISDRFILDNGQRDTYYDIGYLQLKRGASAPNDPIRVIFDYFEHGAGDYFSVDSYSGVLPYDRIPSYTRQKDGISIPLADALDFRPRINDAGTGFTGTGAVVTGTLRRGSDLQADLSYYLPRTDLIELNHFGEMRVSRGTSSTNPAPNLDDPEVMKLYTVFHLPYTINTSYPYVKIEEVDNRRYTMRDIGAIDRRVSFLEKFSALSLNEQKVQGTAYLDPDGFPYYKNGYLVDTFADHRIGDFGSPDYLAAIDPIEQELRPSFTPFSVNLYELNTNDAQRSSAKYALTGDLITLAYTNVKYLEQKFASQVELINPLITYNWQGRIELTPPSDTWVDTVRAPANIIRQEGNFTEVVNQVGVDPKSPVKTVWNDWTNVGQQYALVARDRITSIETDISLRSDGSLFSQSTTTFGDRQIFRVGEEQTERDADGNITSVTVAGGNTRTQVRAAQDQARTGVTSRVVTKINNESLGDKVIQSVGLPWMRAQPIRFLATGLKPQTKVRVFFDGVDVTQYCVAPGTITLSSRTAELFNTGSNVGGAVRDPARRVVGSEAAWRPGDALPGFPTGNAVVSAYNRGGIVTGATSGATGILIGQDFANNTILRVQNVIGTFLPGETIVSGNASGIVSSFSPTGNLTTNPIGTVGGIFNLPNNNQLRFATGRRQFVLTDSASNGTDSTTQASTFFTASGRVEVLQENIISTRNAEVVTTSASQTRTVIPGTNDPVTFNPAIPRTQTFVIPDATPLFTDPLAQSFAIDDVDGVFVTALDLYFAAVPTEEPVTVEIREMQNGFPTRIVVPFGRAVLTPADCISSLNASTPTRVTFPSPVYLKGQTEYCFVVLSNNLQASLWACQGGSVDITTGQRITKQPYLGSLYVSQNNSVWNPVQDKDLKFTIYRANFAVGAGNVGVVEIGNYPLENVFLGTQSIQTYAGNTHVRVYQPDHGFTVGSNVTLGGFTGNVNGIIPADLNKSHLVQYTEQDSYVVALANAATATGFAGEANTYASRNFIYDTIQVHAQELNFQKTGTEWFFKKTSAKRLYSDSDVAYVTDSTWTPILNNVKTNLSKPAVLASEENEDTYLGGEESLFLRVELSSESSLLSPVIDVSRLAAHLYANKLDAPSYVRVTVPGIDNLALGNVGGMSFVSSNSTVVLTSANAQAAFANIGYGKYITISNTTSNNNTFFVFDKTSDGTKVVLRGANVVTESNSSVNLTVHTRYTEESAPIGGFAAATYISRPITVVNPASGIRINLDVNRPDETDVAIYYRTVKQGSTVALEDTPWEYFTPEATPPVTATSYEFSTVYWALDEMDEFVSVQVKVVMRSNNSAKVPRCKNLRIVTLS